MAGLMIDAKKGVGLDTDEDLRSFFETKLLPKITKLLPRGVRITSWKASVFGEKEPLRYFVVYFNKPSENLFHEIGGALRREFGTYLSRFDST